MIKFDVKNRWTGAVQFIAEIDCNEDERRSIKLGLSVKWAIDNGADLYGANLYGASLDRANLDGASLYRASLDRASLDGASLDGASGLNDFVKCIQIETYSICYTATEMQIGCERHGISEWRTFDDRRILEMDGKSALKFWRKYKDWIFNTIELCPAKPTGASK